MFKINLKEATKISSTSLQGYFPEDVTYKDLVKVFGEPNSFGDDYKVDVEWRGEINDKIFTIYNYKTGKNYLGTNGQKVEDITDWHIGGKTKSVAVDLNVYFNQKKGE
jgi:hypothetical protein